MEEKNAAIVERLSRIDALMKRYQGQRFRGGRRGGRRGMANPHRGQGRVLTLLRLQPEITQKDLGYLLDMRTQSLGELLSKLEKAGYITKEPSEADRRSMVVKLTPEGAKAAENLADSEDEWSVVFGDFTEEESDQLIALLDKLIASLERAAEAEGGSDGRGRPTPPPRPGASRLRRMAGELRRVQRAHGRIRRAHGHGPARRARRARPRRIRRVRRVRRP